MQLFSRQSILGENNTQKYSMIFVYYFESLRKGFIQKGRTNLRRYAEDYQNYGDVCSITTVENTLTRTFYCQKKEPLQKQRN